MSLRNVLGELLRGLVRRRTAEAISGLDPARTRLVVGLGNPGPEFADTRHNLGFRCAEELARRCGAAWQDRTRQFSSVVAVVHPSDDLTLVLAKPQTYMNRSGPALKTLLEFLQLDRQHVLAVYDDMDLPLGALRLRERGSPGTHNGMRSVVSSLGTEDIPRLRIGIGQSWPGEATSHVLSEFSEEERELVDALIQRAADAVLAWTIGGPKVAMNRYNKA